MEYFHTHRGFTLIELLVVLAIIMVITTITLTSQGSFNKTLTLANTAYDIALSFRSAETYGIGSRVAGTVSNTGYGLHFNRAAQDSFTLFADTYPVVGSSPSLLCHVPPTNDPIGPAAKPGNCSYDAGQGELVTDYALGNRITISNFCALSGTWSCANTGAISTMNVVFARPNPDPFIRTNVSSATAACIAVTSPQGGFRYVSVAASGAITANATSCP